MRVSVLRFYAAHKRDVDLTESPIYAERAVATTTTNVDNTTKTKTHTHTTGHTNKMSIACSKTICGNANENTRGRV